MNTVAFDSNILTYFIEAVYLTDTDIKAQCTPSDMLRTQIALVHACFYSGDKFVIVPAADHEFEAIPCKGKREEHWVFARGLIHTRNIPTRKCQEVDEKLECYRKYHKGEKEEKDCRILAQAEAVNCNILLTYDNDFYKNLKPHASIAIKKPIEYWESLGVPKGSPSKHSTYGSSQLSRETWWKW